MNRRRARTALGLIAAGIATACAVRVYAISGPMRWNRRPRITVVSATEDPRIPLVRDAVDFWNRTLAEVGTPFRLGELTVVTGSVPDADVQALSGQVLSRTWWPSLPASMDRFPGDLLVVLSDASFISCAAHRGDRVVVAIKN